MSEDSEERSSIELEVEVVGTPEEVWRAIATGPGVSSWYVPHEIEERAGGAAAASFGPGPEMQVPGRVVEWDPPNRVVFDGGEGVVGLAFEWLVEAKDGGTCVVRLINSGFGSGTEWDDQYDAMTDGWRMFMFNLQLHLKHFGGQSARASLPMALWPDSRASAWAKLTRALGIPAAPSVGDQLKLRAGDGPAMSGVVVEAHAQRLSLLLDEPAKGTGIIAAEGHGDQTGVSVWSYLYGPEGEAAIERDEPRWFEWLGAMGSE